MYFTFKEFKVLASFVSSLVIACIVGIVSFNVSNLFCWAASRNVCCFFKSSRDLSSLFSAPRTLCDSVSG